MDGIVDKQWWQHVYKIPHSFLFFPEIYSSNPEVYSSSYDDLLNKLKLHVSRGIEGEKDMNIF